MFNRLAILQKFIIVVLAYVLFHLIVISLFDPYNLQSAIEWRHTTSKELKYYHRGDIYDRNGDLLVTTQYNYQLDIDKGLINKKLKQSFSNPVQLRNQQQNVLECFSRIVSGSTNRDEGVINRKLQGAGNCSVFLGDNFLITDIKEIKKNIFTYFQQNQELGLSGSQAVESLISTRISEERVYPCENLAPRLLGLAIPDTLISSPDESGPSRKQLFHLKGLCGMEKTFESYLSGQDGWEETLIDALGDKVLKPSLKSKKARDGLDIYLTINRHYQEIMEQKLREGLNKYQAKNAMGVIMDVNTGEILALAGEHENDQNLPVAQLRSYSNLPVSYCLEPGSTMKPITALLALENELYERDELIDCSTLVQYFGNERRTIRDHDPFDELTLEDIIVESSNPGISRVAQKLGKEKLYNRLDEMGLGRKTLSKIYGESNGIMRKLSEWGEYSLSSVAFGQEISLNMLHLAVIYASFANGGKILRPQILLHCSTQDSIRYHELEPTVFNTVSSSAHLQELQKFLRNVVVRGTADDTNLEYIEISGKTGTSEIITVKADKTVETRHNSLFAGYLPSDNPQIVMIVAFDRCKEDENKYYYASQSAVPVFKEIVQSLLVLQECDLAAYSSPDKEEMVVLPSLVGMKKKQAERILKKHGLDFVYVNNKHDGIISDQHPPANMRFNKFHTVKLALAEEAEKITDKKLMPDFKGFTLREALSLARSRQINITSSGCGVVISQTIPPLREITLEDECHLILE